MQRDQELPIRPGSCVSLAGVMALDFESPSLADEAAIDETVAVSQGITTFTRAPASHGAEEPCL